jgi:hypothetical protein
MRNFKQTLIVLLMSMSLVTLSSCSSDDDGGGGGQAAAGTVTAKINGTTFTSLEVASVANYVAAGNVMTIQGSDADGKAILLVINGYEGEGTYEIGGDNSIFVSGSYTEIDINTLTSETWTAPYAGGELAGSISISEETEDNLKGTFEFSARNDDSDIVKNITDGSFNVSKQNN